jgi:hypothetical protein
MVRLRVTSDPSTIVGNEFRVKFLQHGKKPEKCGARDGGVVSITMYRICYLYPIHLTDVIKT